MGETVKAEREQKLFELAPEQVEVCLRVSGAGGRYELRHRLRPPRLDDWREYERNLRSTVETAEHDRDALQFDSAPLEAAAALYDRLFLGADGYSLAGGLEGISPDRVPLNHKEMAIRALSDVGPAPRPEGSPGEDAEVALFSLDPEQVEVTLEASRSGTSYQQLTHVFAPPNAADRVEYSRVTSQALYVRGSRSLKTLLPARLPGLAALYDRLILEARGYAAAGGELKDRAAIAKHMDPLHKKAAVQMLFEE